MESKFYVGQEVICLDDKWIMDDLGDIRPKKDQILTIREIYRYKDKTGLRFEEIVNEPRKFSDTYGERCFNAKYFAPIERTKTKYVIKEIEVAPQIREMEVQLS